MKIPLKYIAALVCGFGIASWLVGESNPKREVVNASPRGLLENIQSNGIDPDERASELYSPVGKRDPFKVPSDAALGREPASLRPLEKFSIQQLELRAILRGLGTPSALFEDPEGKTYIAKEGDLVGRERATLSRILKSEVILTEKTVNYLGKEGLYERVISLPK